MNPENSATGILVVGHGSPRAQANQGFVEMVGRLADRLGVQVLPTFFSLARPNIEDQVAGLVGRGVRHIVLMPYFLYTGQHVSKDIPALLAECEAKFPGVKLELLETLENDRDLAEIVAERLRPYVQGDALPEDGPGIERRSHEIIDRQLGPDDGQAAAHRAILRRIIHATADFSYARSLRIHPDAVGRALAAMEAGKPIICDVRMLQAGITRSRAEVLCAVGEARTAELAARTGQTRSAAAMEILADRLDGAIVAVGNAPTALLKVMQMHASGGPTPALVVGLPVGFVGALESKTALMGSGLCYITNASPRGGSPVAAAAINALALLHKGVNNG
jgi:precorrin-8X/cobalt-precorrin-8 methylmutase